jgi:hypothetical protein
MTEIIEKSREEKIRELVAAGHDLWAAENIADGRPEWSQRIVNTEIPLPARPVVAPEPLSLGDLPKLEEQLGHLLEEKKRFEAQLRESQGKLQVASSGESAATDLLKSQEGVPGRDARVMREEAAEAILRNRHEQTDAIERRKRNENWLKAVKARIENFPHDEIKRLRKLNRQVRCLKAS